jgi:hypothetical protein
MNNQNKQPDAIELLLDSARGVFIPQNFVESFSLVDWHVSENDRAVLAKGPDDNECYWDVWDCVLNSAHYDYNGKAWTLYQDGDLWAVCLDLMSEEEKSNFGFGE